MDRMENMRSVSDVAEYIAARKVLCQKSWQIFDLSEVRDMTDEMQRQYVKDDGSVRFSSPLPAENCVFFDGQFAIISSVEGDKITCALAQELEVKEIESYMLGRAQEVMAWVDGDPTAIARLRSKMGDDKANDLVKSAKKRVEAGMSENDFYGVCAVGDYTDAPECIMAAIFSEFISFPIAQSEVSKITRPTRRRIKRLGVDIRLSTVSLSPPKARYSQEDHAPGEKRPLHFCRGHWRRSNSCRARPMPTGDLGVWIEGHWKGDPDYGIVVHNYVATAEDMRKRSKLAA